MIIGWQNCAAAECAPWQYWLPVMLDGLVSLDCSVSGSAGGEWRVHRVRSGLVYFTSKALAFELAECCK